MNDSYFDLPSNIFSGHALGSLGTGSLDQLRTRAICDGFEAVRESTVGHARCVRAGRDVFMRGAQVVQWLTLTDSKLRRLEMGTESERRLAARVRAFQKLVPLLSDPHFRTLVSGLAPKWQHVDQGSEAMVFEADSGDVYKLMPIREAVLEVPPITALGAPIYARPIAHHLMNAFSDPTIIARVAAMNGSRGFARSEIVGITGRGAVLVKQPNLGRASEVVLPTMRELREWAELHGHEILPSQADDPHDQVEGASSLMPIVTKIGEGFYIGTDIVPRNARNTPEEVLVFDPVLRRLRSEEIELHPEIRDAVNRLLQRAGGPAFRRASERPTRPVKRG